MPSVYLAIHWNVLEVLIMFNNRLYMNKSNYHLCFLIFVRQLSWLACLFPSMTLEKEKPMAKFGGLVPILVEFEIWGQTTEEGISLFLLLFVCLLWITQFCACSGNVFCVWRVEVMKCWLMSFLVVGNVWYFYIRYKVIFLYIKS